jgi:hypothetical protein
MKFSRTRSVFLVTLSLIVFFKSRIVLSQKFPKMNIIPLITAPVFDGLTGPHLYRHRNDHLYDPYLTNKWTNIENMDNNFDESHDFNFHNNIQCRHKSEDKLMNHFEKVGIGSNANDLYNFPQPLEDERLALMKEYDVNKDNSFYGFDNIDHMRNNFAENNHYFNNRFYGDLVRERSDQKENKVKFPQSKSNFKNRFYGKKSRILELENEMKPNSYLKSEKKTYVSAGYLDTRMGSYIDLEKDYLSS